MWWEDFESDFPNPEGRHRVNGRIRGEGGEEAQDAWSVAPVGSRIGAKFSHRHRGH